MPYKPTISATVGLVTPVIANLLLRLASGSLLFIIVVATIVYAPAEIFIGLLCIVLFMILKEWFNLIPSTNFVIFSSCYIIILLVLIFYQHIGNLLLWLGLWYPYALMRTLRYAMGKDTTIPPIVKRGEAVICLLCFAFCAIIIQQFSSLLAGLCFALVCLSDIGGYTGGKLIGGAKLCPRLSPNKTIAGFISSILCCYGGYFILLTIFPSVPHSILFISLLLPFNLITQGGDLYQSMLKRQANKKDSAHWIPGHGGLFDRTDGLLFGVPAFYALLLCELPSLDLPVQ